MKKISIFTALVVLLLSVSSCSDFLDQEPDGVLSDESVFNDPKLIKSELANFYDRVSYGAHVRGDLYDYTRIDEAIRYDHDDVNSFDRNRWREYNYELVRNINDFILKLKTVSTLPDEETGKIEGKNRWISEARFIRAWYYFCSARILGGVPVVGDEVFDYKPGDPVEPLQIARSTEAGIYDYIIKECQEVAKVDLLGDKQYTNASRPNIWAAKMLEARAALYAASIAKYGASTPTVATDGKEVSIDATKAAAYYKIALDAAEYVIANGPYLLQDKMPDDRATNFYNAVCIKSTNTEVIWARDYKYPGQTHGFTKDCLPTVLAQDAGSCYLSVLLNLAEEFEPINAATPGQREPFNTGTLTSPVFYESPSAPFLERDPRLAGTAIIPGGYFAGEEIILQAGQLNKDGGNWVKREGGIGSKDDAGNYITGPNGPIANRDRLYNKTGFTIRKFLDETTGAGTIGRGSEMWEVRFRMAEAYLIAAEASLEINGGTHAQTLRNINAVRIRAGVKPLTTVTFDNIVHERRVEFAFEGHRIWDLRRWRLAHTLWTGSQSDVTAKRRGLWAYQVVAPGDANDGKWYFEERDMNFLYPNALRFELNHYYAEMDNDWLNRNPKLVKNPFQ
ncbi:MAG: RagB/SusD family nutrient uptake outer membrane protein [Dysgonomonas sp.]|nr:RagB/SusD family nutrient uptake outer membrane protein [Dysgonomonas sp.]